MQLTRQDLRRLVITKQHLDGKPRPPMLDVIRDLGCLQLDPISAVERSHLLVLWSRLGQYDTAVLDHLMWEDRQLFEYWAHAASIVLTEEYPVHHWHMRQVGRDQKWRDWFDEKQVEPLLDYIHEYLRKNGATLSKDIDDGGIDKNYDSVWWSGKYKPRVLDYLWSRGDVMVCGRKSKQRIWGLADDFLPDWTPRDIWDDDQITHFAVQRSIKALGAATAKQIKAHYTRNRYPNLNKVLQAMVKAGTLYKVDIIEDGVALKGEWYLHADDVPLLEKIQAGDFVPRTTLLSPFDNLICDRERTEMLWDFYFRIEIYVPKEKREYGYYVLPILHGDRLIGRIDSRMNRKTNTLEVNHVYAENDAPKNDATVTAIQSAIQSLANFLGSNNVDWGVIPDSWKTLTR